MSRAAVRRSRLAAASISSWAFCEDAAGPQCLIGAFPERARDMLASGFHVRHGAAAELGALGELGLAQPGRPAIGGKLRA